MSFVVGGVTLQYAPSRVMKRLPANVDSFELDSGLPILIVPCLEALELTVEGFFYGAKSTIETTYLDPLEALQGSEVTVAFPDGRYDGSWVLADFTYSEVSAKLFRYSLKLLRGSSHIT